MTEPSLRASRTWTRAESAQLLRCVEDGVTLSVMAAQFGRFKRDIRNRWFHLYNTAHTDQRPPSRSVIFSDDPDREKVPV